MATTWGLTSVGFYNKTLADILNDVGPQELAQISTGLNLQPTSLIGVLNGVFGQQLADLWLLGQYCYSGMSPSTASGDQLVSLSLITGTVKTGPAPTRVASCIVNVAAGFSCDVGDLYATLSGNRTVQFTNLEAISNPTGAAVNVTVDFECTTNGPISAPAGTLTVIAQSLTGWNSITNTNDGVLGTNDETDAQLRSLRTSELAASGSATSAALGADLLEQLTAGGTTSVTVLHNDSDSVDANGLPPHSIEVIAYLPGNTPTDDQALANLIFSLKGDGINTHGTSSATVQDTYGNYEVVYFTRPQPVSVYVTTDVASDPTIKNTLGAATIAASVNGAIDAFINASLVGGQRGLLYWRHVEAEEFVTGVLDVNSFAISAAPAPTTATNIAISIRQIPVVAANNIIVSVDGVIP